MLDAPIFVCPLLNDVMTKKKIKKEDLTKKIRWPEIKIILFDPDYKINYSKMQNLVAVLNKLKPVEYGMITAQSLDYWFTMRYEYINTWLPQSKLYICPLLNKVRSKNKVKVEDLAENLGWTEEKLKRVLYDSPTTKAEKYYPISYNDMQNLVVVLNELKPANFKMITEEDIDKEFKLRHECIMDIMPTKFKTYFDEIIFIWLSGLDTIKAMQIAKYFDLYDTIDDLTARIAYCFVYMNDESKTKLKQKMFSISANDIIFYTTTNCEYIAGLIDIRKSIKDKAILKKFPRRGNNDGKILAEVSKRILDKLDIDMNIGNRILFSKFEDILKEATKPQKLKTTKSQKSNVKFSNADIKSIIKRNSEVYTEEQRAEDFDNAIDVEEANKFIWKMNLFASEDCEDIDVWELIIVCSLLYNPDKTPYERAHLLEYLKYAEELFMQSCKLEDAKKAYLPLEF